MKKYGLIITVLILVFSFCLPTFAENEANSAAEYEILRTDFDVESKSAVLMDAKTGTVLYEKNKNEAYSPASVTKIMTILLVMEALDEGSASLEDKITVSSYAASMGGSQVFLEEGEVMSVEELLKCAVIASANDASVALAEHIAGSESAFVARMNARAGELGMRDTVFMNATGLDDTEENLTSAVDIAIMSRELISHEKVLEYSSIWQDTIRDGEFTLTNTNRLVRYYDGCNGLKTGSTSKAGFCMSATAKRGDLQLIAVVMGAPTRDSRNSIARNLLDYGFASYALYTSPECELESAPVLGGCIQSAALYGKGFSALVNKADLSRVEVKYDIPESISAPISAGAAVGKIEFFISGVKLGECDIFVKEEISKIDFLEVYKRVIGEAILGKKS